MNTLDDDGKLYQKYLNKKINAKKEGLLCELSFEEFCFLVDQAGLKSSDLGFSGKGYVLARFNDCGNYCLGNCRFITHKENMAEQHLSEKVILARKENFKKLVQARKDISKDVMISRIKEGQKTSEKYKEYRRKLKEKKELRLKYINEHKDKRHSGIKNSHYGTFWITNGVVSKVWSKSKGDLPDGFYLGRVCKKKI